MNGGKCDTLYWETEVGGDKLEREGGADGITGIGGTVPSGVLEELSCLRVLCVL